MTMMVARNQVLIKKAGDNGNTNLVPSFLYPITKNSRYPLHSRTKTTHTLTHRPNPLPVTSHNVDPPKIFIMIINVQSIFKIWMKHRFDPTRLSALLWAEKGRAQCIYVLTKQLVEHTPFRVRAQDLHSTLVRETASGKLSDRICGSDSWIQNKTPKGTRQKFVWRPRANSDKFAKGMSDKSPNFRIRVTPTTHWHFQPEKATSIWSWSSERKLHCCGPTIK